MKRDPKEIVSIYLLKKFIVNEKNEPEESLKVGHTKRDFIRVPASRKNSRGDEYNVTCSPESIGYELLGIIRAPRILENMFHIKYNNLRLANYRTGRKSEWMLYSDSAVNDFFSPSVFEDICKDLSDNRDIYFSGKNNLYVKEKIIKFLEYKKKEDFKYIGERLKEIIKASTIPKQSPTSRNIVCGILDGKFTNGLSML